MTYWYMQLHGDEQYYPDERYYPNFKILKQAKFIGLIGFEREKEYVVDFINEIKVNDIVLVTIGSIVIALVQVIGKAMRKEILKMSLEDHLKIKRKVKILDFNQFNGKDNFPTNKKILKKIADPSSKEYQYIDKWYKKIIKIKTEIKGIKINRIYINSYKMFKNFSIKFTDNEGYITPITIIAGINGSGKTSLLNYIADFNNNHSKCDDISLLFNGEIKTIQGISTQKEKLDVAAFNNAINYFPVSISKGERLEKQINRYINELVFEKDYKPTDAYNQLQSNINDIFSEINLKIEFSGLNKDKQTLFTNASGNRFPMAALSTGEKTLLTRVLYLYLSDIKDQIILIDEPEISLHPNWQNAVVPLYEAFAKQNNNQIIIATHSPHIISGAKNGSVKLLHLENAIVSVENVQHNYGIEVSNALTEVMGLEHSRPLSIDNKIADLKKLLIKNKTNEFNRLMQELEEEIGKQDTDLRMLKIEMNIRNKNAQD